MTYHLEADIIIREWGQEDVIQTLRSFSIDADSPDEAIGILEDNLAEHGDEVLTVRIV